MTDPQKSSEALPHSDSPSSAAAISSSYSQSKMVKWLKNNVPTLLKKNVPTLLKIYPIRAIFGGIMTLVVGGGASNEEIRSHTWRMIGGTLDSAPLGGHRIRYNFADKSVTSQFILSESMKKNIAKNPIKEIQVTISFDPNQQFADLYIEDVGQSYDKIKLERKGRGTLLDSKNPDRFLFTLDDRDLKKVHLNQITIISVEGIALSAKKGTFMVDNIVMK